jgi:hypothetical protein
MSLASSWQGSTWQQSEKKLRLHENECVKTKGIEIAQPQASDDAAVGVDHRSGGETRGWR